MKFNILLILTFLLFGCNTGKNTQTSEQTACNTIGIVKDFSKLDGCKLLIETEKGILLKANELPQGSFLTAGAKIRFDYEKMPEAMSICMREKMIIRITCLEAMAD